MVEIAPGAMIGGAGLAFIEGVGHHQPPQPVTIDNSGDVLANGKGKGVVALRGNGGLLTYQGAGTLTNTGDGAAILARNSSDIALVVNGAVTSGVARLLANGRTATPAGLEATEIGTGNIVVDGAGSVSAQAGRGLIVEQSKGGHGSVVVTGTGDVTGGGTICPGIPHPNPSRNGKTGCSGIRAAIDGSDNSGDIIVTRTGNITGTSTAINAFTRGRGNIAITTGDSARIVGASEFGIEAESKGHESSGSITITTGANGQLMSGGDGIFAENLASKIANHSGSTITINAAGVITSGSFPYAALNTKNATGALAGISTGYAGGKSATPNAAVHGSVFINNAATINALVGDGVLAYNYGAGSINIASTAPITAAGGNGIHALATFGRTNISLTGPGAIVTGSGAGHAALDVQAWSGSTEVTIGAGAVLQGLNGAAGVALTGSGAHGTFIRNAGTIAGANPAGSAGGVGITGSDLSIFNIGTIAGGRATGAGPAAQAYAVVFTGGTDSIGGSGAIDGGIAVLGLSSFMPALSSAAVGTPLLVDGPLQFASSATYDVRLRAGAADAVAVTGAATLKGATVRAESVGAPPSPHTSTTILFAAGGIVGRFNPVVTSNLAFLQPTLSYDANHVVLTPHYAYTLPGSTQNEMNVGTALTKASGPPRSGAGATLFGALKKVATAKGPAVLDSLSGEGLAAAQNLAQRSSELFTSTIFDQTILHPNAEGQTSPNSITLIEVPPSFLATALGQDAPVRELADVPRNAFQPVAPIAPARTWRAWGTGFGAAEQIQGDARIGSARQDDTIYGGALGVDDQLTPFALVGVAVGGSDGTFRVDDRGTTGSTTGGHIAVYDLVTYDAFYGASSSSFSYFDNRATRTVGGFGGLGSETERAAFGSDAFRTRLEFGRSLAFTEGTFSPFVALEAAALRVNGFTEHPISGPGLLTLDVSGQSTASVPSFIGARLQPALQLGHDITLSPTLQLAYVHEFAPYRQQSATFSALPGSTFLVDGARPSRNAADVQAGAEISVGATSVIFASFDGEVSGVDQLYAGKGGFKLHW